MNFGRILKKKAPLKEDEVDREDLGDRWTFVHVLPRSSFIQTVHHGKRTKEAGWEFVQKIKQNSDGEAPLFLSDGWPSYPDLLAHAYRDRPVFKYLFLLYDLKDMCSRDSSQGRQICVRR